MKKLAFCIGLASLILTALTVLSGCKPAQKTLSLLVWEGYADPAFVKSFEEQCKCKVIASYMGSSDELVAKLRGGSAANYDVISPSSDVATSIVTSGLAAQLDMSLLPTYEKLSAKLRAFPMIHQGDKVFGVPFVWGPDPLLYDTTAFPKAPGSWGDLWSPKLKGKISVWDDLSTLYMAAQVLGYDKPDPNAIFNLTDEQLANVKKKLLALKPNIRKIWATGGELTNLFQNHEIVAAMGWPLMTNQLRKLKFPIGETLPKENTTGWIDHMMVTAASKNKVLATQFLEYLIQAKTQKIVTDITGAVPANAGAAEFMTAEEKKNLHLDHVDAYMAKLIFWQNVPRRDKYNEVWNEVKAAQ